MRAKSSELSRREVGDVVAVEIESGVFCYVRKFAFGYGILPFFSAGGPLPSARLPTVKPAQFFDVWVYRDDSTPARFIGSFPFDSVEESWGQPTYEPPDAIEPCFRVHGVFNGLASVIKPVEEKQVVGMRILKRYQPREFRGFLAGKRAAWPTISA